VANGASLDTWLNWVKGNYRSNWHPIGTAAMMSKDLGGVVDSRNRVYGVSGLRVVDGSILPFQVSSHLMSVLYGLVSFTLLSIFTVHLGTIHSTRQKP
jgi:choline dehydrogenase-like flavoprotein